MCGTITGCAMGALLPSNYMTLVRVSLALRCVFCVAADARYSLQSNSRDVSFVRPASLSEDVACYRYQLVTFAARIVQ